MFVGRSRTTAGLSCSLAFTTTCEQNFFMLDVTTEPADRGLEAVYALSDVPRPSVLRGGCRVLVRGVCCVLVRCISISFKLPSCLSGTTTGFTYELTTTVVTSGDDWPCVAESCVLQVMNNPLWLAPIFGNSSRSKLSSRVVPAYTIRNTLRDDTRIYEPFGL